MSDSSFLNAAIVAAQRTFETLKAAAEKAETAAQNAELADCEIWARYGGSHTDPPPGHGPMVKAAKAVAKAAADAAEKARQDYEDLQAQAS
jgi:hypothetical protein